VGECCVAHPARRDDMGSPRLPASRVPRVRLQMNAARKTRNQSRRREESHSFGKKSEPRYLDSYFRKGAPTHPLPLAGAAATLGAYGQRTQEPQAAINFHAGPG